MFGSPVLKRNQDGSTATWLVDTGSHGEQHSQRCCKGTQRSGLQGLLTESDFFQKRNSKGNLAETSALGPGITGPQYYTQQSTKLLNKLNKNLIDLVYCVLPRILQLFIPNNPECRRQLNIPGDSQNF